MAERGDGRQQVRAGRQRQPSTNCATDGGLYVNGALCWANSKDFALANDGSLLLLNTNGSLDKLSNASWQNLSTGVIEFALSSTGAVYRICATTAGCTSMAPSPGPTARTSPWPTMARCCC